MKEKCGRLQAQLFSKLDTITLDDEQLYEIISKIEKSYSDAFLQS